MAVLESSVGVARAARVSELARARRGEEGVEQLQWAVGLLNECGLVVTLNEVGAKTNEIARLLAA